MVNRSFGSVRNPNTTVKDVSGSLQGLPTDYVAGGYGSYASASGSLKAEIEAASEDLEVKKRNMQNSVEGYQSAKNKAQGGYCADRYNNTFQAAKRDSCQAQANAAMQNAKSAMDSAKTAYENAKSKLDLLRKELKAEIESELALSEQGLTPEAINTQAEAEAQAFLMDAQANAKSKQSGSKVRNTILILVGLAAVTIGVIYAVKKLRKK